LKFFTDRDLGKLFPKLLIESGIKTIRHSDYFKDNASDQEWISMAGKKGWFCLSHNKKIRYVPIQKEAVKQSRVGLFLLVGHTNNRELAENFIATIYKVKKFIKKNKRPFIAKIYRSSKMYKSSNRKRPGDVKLCL
jgi:hypothetical protein